MKNLRFEERIEFCKNAIGKKLLNLMVEKETNLSFSVDVTRAEEVLQLADKVGPEICVLKTHVDILENFSLTFTKELQTLARRHQFLIFEDRKFADIGHTVKLQYEKGVYHIADWADMTNAHSLPGPGIVEALQEVGLAKQRGLLLLAEMSSKGNLLDKSYAQKTLQLAEQFPEFVFGFIAQEKLSDHPGWIYLTPGIQQNETGDNLGQQYTTPEKAIQQGSDVIIVGRGILKANNPAEAAKAYRQSGWQAYRLRINAI